MKIPTTPKAFRQALSLLLCCMLLISSLGLSAFAAEGEPSEPATTVQPADEPGGDSNSDPVPGTDGPEDPAGDPTADPSGTPDINPTFAPPSPDDTTVIVRYELGEFGMEAETVTIGECPANVPEIPEMEAWKGYKVQGWYTSQGKKVDPAEVPVTENTIYTARWVRSVDALMVTEEHKAYINGHSNGLLLPMDDITRAEAAKLFSNLLRTKDFEHTPSFKDVKADDWYADAVGLVNALGIATGYKNETFRPNARITRAEFIKMAATCDEIVSGSLPFTDVSEKHWAAPYIASAYAKGWISGDSEGTFRPDDYIMRVEALKILNNMLGRKPDEKVESMSGIRNFCDVFPNFWGYKHIIEASTDHSFTVDEDGTERWTEHTQYTSKAKSGWLRYEGKTYYVGKDGKCLRGEHTLDGVKVRFDPATGAGSTGFYTVGSWKRYYKNGRMLEDISGLGVVKGPYYIKVYKPSNYLIVFAKDEKGKYNIPVRAMLTSCGNPTPTGDFYTPNRFRWLQMVGGSWAQWCTQIEGSYLFHSVPNDYKNNTSMWVNEYNLLGTTRSLGCIRLTCADAKWMYDNCALGTHVYISPTETDGPLKRPTTLKLPAGHTWDPTDPTAYYLCRQRGCH